MIMKTLKNTKLNIELEAEHDGFETVDVDVHDTKRNIWGTFALCDDTGCFHDDKPLTGNQQEWLESEEVGNWMDSVGY
jgi:hypothetical protein